MVCANPDLTVERGDKIVYCAGALAVEYEKLGGSVAYAGKPFLPVYDLALARLAEIKGRPIERAQILAIGDGIRTDIKGAAAAGIDSVFIASGIHVAGGHIDEATLATLFSDLHTRPIAAMPALSW
jgi:HAD superfamily hydrolase (TIGR01459 family)